MSIETLEQSKTEQFAGTVVNILNGGALAMMISIGHRTGLLDTMAALPPSTSREIAAAAGLNERYVREWLGAMATGRIVEYDSTYRLFHLPAEHAAMLTRAASPNNMAVAAQFISVLGNVEDQIVEAFRKGGGVPYSAYPRFHEVMAEESAQTVIAALIDSILPLVPGLIAALKVGIEVLDVGCGRGRALMKMAEEFPNSRFTGYDFSEEAMAWAQAEAARLGLANIRFEVRDAAALDDVERFHLITAFDAVHDQAHPDKMLEGIARALRKSGTFLMQDIAGSSHVHGDMDNALAPFNYTISCMHCMTVSLAQGGAGLGAMWGKEQALRMLNDAGFTFVEVHQLPHDVLNYFYVAVKR